MEITDDYLRQYFDAYESAKEHLTELSQRASELTQALRKTRDDVQAQNRIIELLDIKLLRDNARKRFSNAPDPTEARLKYDRDRLAEYMYMFIAPLQDTSIKDLSHLRFETEGSVYSLRCLWNYRGIEYTLALQYPDYSYAEHYEQLKYKFCFWDSRLWNNVVACNVDPETLIKAVNELIVKYKFASA